jgi:gas vesicle protein
VSSFTTGFCVGLGLSLLFTPKKGEEMRHLVGERIRTLRASSSENQELTPLVTQTRPRLEEVPGRAEPAMAMGTTTPTASPVQQTASSMRETQQELNRAAQQMGTTPPGTSPVRETTSSVEETQTDLNRVMRQPGTDNPPLQRRPGSLADQ